MKVLVRERPRSVAIATEESVLVFRYFVQDKGARKSRDNERPKVIVEFVAHSEFDTGSYKPLTHRECFGFLGIINVEGDIFLCCITHKAQVASPRPGETIFKIHAVEFFCLTSSDWDFVNLDANGYAIEQTNGMSNMEGRAPPTTEHPCANIRKLLSNGSFYYSTDFDITAVLQDRGTETRSMTVDTIDEAFMWNSYMMSELIQFRSRLPQDERAKLDHGGFLTFAIRGFAGTMPVRLNNRVTGHLTIISRQSHRRAGTRYNVRGVDDDGNVANFVETETVLCVDNGKKLFGYTQVRGSVPVFWEQDANLLQAKVNITRSVEASQPAFNKHFDNLGQKFGNIHAVNLLSPLKPQEEELSQRYRQGLESVHSALDTDIGLTEFDFHSEVARGGFSMAANIIPRIQNQMAAFGYYSADDTVSTAEQSGIMRTNCLDCLDRTNMIQSIISKEALEGYLATNGIQSNPELWARHNTLWADNGDQLSQIYAGTNALKTSFSRSGKMGLAGAIADVTKSVGRMYINNFVDKGRQNTIDILLGLDENQLQVVLHDPINDYVTAELNRRQNEFSSTKTIKVFAGTFNLNGVMADDDLTPWLFPNQEDRSNPADIYLIGFQELVELTAQQILNTDPARRAFWEKKVQKCLNHFGSYVLLRSGQLVGTGLFLFAKKDHLENITKVEGTVKKTGLGGMAGNKGGVAVSFKYCHTSLCFVTAHLASGMNNATERHQDYKTLSTGLRFARGRSIKDHDTIIWLGDFNYRVELPYDHVRKLISTKDYQSLLESDQLIKQMYKGNTFPYYNEGKINFDPTYKFDKGTHEYDTSEKQRVPAWTDRILSRGNNIRQLSYGSSPHVVFSDHRPVYATFQTMIIVVDEAKKKKLSDQLYDKRRAEIGNSTDLISLIDLNEDFLSHGMPPPSSDAKKWWISGGRTAKVSLNPPERDMVINPYKGANPFSIESNAVNDFVPKPKLPPRPSASVPPPTNSKGKIAPAVPRKPVGLHHSTANTPQNGSSPSANESDNSSRTSLHLMDEDKPMPSSKSQTPPPPPMPRKSRTSSLRSVNSTTSGSGASLLDDGPSEAPAWQPLMPGR